MAEKTKQSKTCKSTKETVKTSPPLKKGEIRMKKFNSTKWKDKKRTVTMISMVQDDSIIHKGRRKQLANGGWEEVMKPVMTEEYNGHVGGTYKADQLLWYYSFSHKTIKWRKRVAFHFTEVAGCS